VDYLVSGVGTGGTITGAGKYLKEKSPSVKLIAVEPASSAVISGEQPGRHAIQGIGAGFIPNVFDRSIINEIITVSDNDALHASRLLSQKEGILAGISAGAAIFAALKVAETLSGVSKNIVAIIPDTGERYISTDLFKN
jgi:cysteine synthase A